MAWADDLSPRGKKNVSVSTVIPRDLARRVEASGDWLVLNGKLKKNTSYAVSQYALSLLADTIEQAMKQ